MAYDGCFLNRDGFSLTPYEPERIENGQAVFEFRLSPTRPLMYYGQIAGRLGYWQPDRHGPTDLGSVPRILQWLPGLDQTRYGAAYIFHDVACRHNQLYVSDTGAPGTYSAYTVSRAHADRMLRHMIANWDHDRTWLGSVSSVVSRWTVWTGVRIGAAGASIGDWWRRTRGKL